MPLIQSGSKKSLKKNIETEMTNNPNPKDRDQNLAIGYSIQRKNRKKMSKGGMAREMPEPIDERVGSEGAINEDESKSDAEMKRDSRMHFDDGGQVKKDMSNLTVPKPVGANDATDQSVQQKRDLFAQGFKKASGYAYGGSILDEEMPEHLDQRAGHESAMDNDESMSAAERIRDQHMKLVRRKMAQGGFAEPEYRDAGRLGFPMMEQENDPDEYSKNGIINYAHGGMAAPEMDEPIDQRAGSESYLDEMEYPIEGHGMGEGEREEEHSLEQENPSIADTIRRKYMASGGMAGNPEYVNKPLDQNAIEHTNYMYKLNRQLGDHEMYSEMDALNDISENEHERDDGGQDSRDIPHDRYDMVDSIRRKYSKNKAV